MTFLQSQIAKPVLSLDGSKIVGRIKNAYLTENFSNIAYFGIEDVSMQKEQTLPFEDVLDFADVAVVQNTARLQDISDVDFTSLCQVRIGMPCYTQNGILKGFVEKAAFSASGKISYFATQTDKFSPSGILSIGDVIVLKNGKTRKAKPQTMPRPKAQTAVTILQDENIAGNKTDNLSAQNENCAENPDLSQDNTDNDLSSRYAFLNSSTIAVSSAPPAISISPDAPKFTKDAFEQIVSSQGIIRSQENVTRADNNDAYTDAHTPARVISDYSFLLGRTLSQDLDTFAGMPFAHKGDKITDTLVNLAMQHGKLVDLALYSVNKEK